MSKRAGSKRGRAGIDARRLKEMAEEAIVDACDESEQISGWSDILDEHLAVPFETTMLGVSVTVEKLELRDDLQIVAICKRGRARQAIEIRELPLPSPRPTGAEWIEAYRHWRTRW